jgi:hypothetical protein
MSGHNEAPTEFEKALPEMFRVILRDIAAYGAARREADGLREPAELRNAERAFQTTMEGLYGYVGRELARVEKPLCDMHETELETLANRFAGSLKGG